MKNILLSILFVSLSILATLANNSSRQQQPECQNEAMFTVINFTANPVHTNNTILFGIDFQLKLAINETTTIANSNFTLRDFVDTCLEHMVVKIRDIKTEQENVETYAIKETDDVNGMISFIIRDYVSIMSTYDVQLGYQQRRKSNNGTNDTSPMITMVANDLCRTCYPNGSRLSYTTRVSASLVEIEWNDRFLNWILFVCYFKAEIIYKTNNPPVQLFETTYNKYHFSRQEWANLLRFSVWTVHDYDRCYGELYPEYSTECSGLLGIGRPLEIYGSNSTTTTRFGSSSTRNTDKNGSCTLLTTPFTLFYLSILFVVLNFIY